MRPYQIVATERILNRIEIANNYKKYGHVAGGGYIWHTTGKNAKVSCNPICDVLMMIIPSLIVFDGVTAWTVNHLENFSYYKMFLQFVDFSYF